MLQLKFDNGILIEVTENHEFYTKTRGKVKAKDLTFEDEIIEFL
jgi:intein/homing endonuclease